MKGWRHEQISASCLQHHPHRREPVLVKAAGHFDDGVLHARADHRRIWHDGHGADDGPVLHPAGAFGHPERRGALRAGEVERQAQGVHLRPGGAGLRIRGDARAVAAGLAHPVHRERRGRLRPSDAGVPSDELREHAQLPVHARAGQPAAVRHRRHPQQRRHARLHGAVHLRLRLAARGHAAGRHHGRRRQRAVSVFRLAPVALHRPAAL